MIFQEFVSSIWQVQNRRRNIKKTISFFIDKNLTDQKFVDLFSKYSNIEYISYKGRCANQSYEYLIRQKINNIYTNMFDAEICLSKDYIELITVPKKLYYRYINGFITDYDFIKSEIETSLEKAQKLKETYAKRKMSLSWSKYKIEVEKYLRKCFDNIIPIYEYNNCNSSIAEYENIRTDNFYIKYICVSLERSFMKYQKAYYGLYEPSTTKNKVNYKRCERCGRLYNANLIGRESKYCDDCKGYIKKEDTKMICIDCGEEFLSNGNSKTTKRCEKCRKSRIKLLNAERQKKYRAK